MHLPVCCEQAIAALRLERGGIFLDATFGRGGHTLQILKEFENRHANHPNFCAHLIAIDQDPQAQAAANAYQNYSNFTFLSGNFVDLNRLTAPYLGQDNKRIAGVLYDLGVSSPQLDDPIRGFSFLRSGPLDMRMDPRTGLSAAEWLEKISPQELEYVLKAYGEERFARKIARAILLRLRTSRIETTQELANLVAKTIGFKEEKHPATRTFQAIRMAVNYEVPSFSESLRALVPLLDKNARIVILTFHGIEVRILRSFLKEDRTASNNQVHAVSKIKLIERIFPSEEEIAKNPRARSATLWVLEKV